MQPIDTSRIPDGTILIAVSGGVDSIALLRLLVERKSLIVAHFNHRIRGDESDADEIFVREQAAALNLPFVHDSADVPAIAAQTGESIEMAARRVRHAFFQKAAKENNCVAIATGHTADDRLETFFLRLARGSSLRGLCSGSATFFSRDGVPLIKPISHLRHKELIEYCKSNGFTWREDSTNASSDYKRNRVRHELVTTFEKTLGASAVASALRTMDLLCEDNEYLESISREYRERRLPACKELAALPLPIFNRVAVDWFYSFPIDPELITSKTLTRFRGMVSTLPRGTQHMPIGQDWYVEKIGENAEMRKCGNAEMRKCGNAEMRKCGNADEPSALPGISHFRIFSDSLFVPPPRSATLELPLSFYVSSEIDVSQISLRAPKPGDRISPAGSGITQKISDVLTNLKIPRAKRRDVIVAVDSDDKIIALPGYATDERAKVRDGENATRVEILATLPH